MVETTQMPRQSKTKEMVQVNLWMPVDLLKILDEWVRDEQTEHPGRAISRSDIIRESLYKCAEERKAKRGQ